MFVLTGTLKSKKDTQQVTETFKKREFVVDTGEGYPNPIPVQLTNDRCGRLNDFNPGDDVKVKFFLRGNEVAASEGKEAKTFVNVEAFSIEKA